MPAVAADQTSDPDGVIVTFADVVEESPDATDITISGGIAITATNNGPGPDQVTFSTDTPTGGGESITIGPGNTIQFFGKQACPTTLPITPS